MLRLYRCKILALEEGNVSFRVFEALAVPEVLLCAFLFNRSISVAEYFIYHRIKSYLVIYSNILESIGIPWNL